ncbi:MAG TPA: hypothetical protein PKY85_04505, partial [Nitrosomonas sp.]|nr:hypothetical protein [Nitrosomonas sp.]
EHPVKKIAMKTTSMKRFKALPSFSEAGISGFVMLCDNRTKFRMIIQGFFTIRLCLNVIQEIIYFEYVKV